MSLPIAAVGPLKVLMKPILTVFCWAEAGCTKPGAARASAVAAATPNLIIVLCPSGLPRPPARRRFVY